MIYSSIKLHILEVYRGDSFTLPLTISSLYPITESTRIKMQVRAFGDMPENPVLLFDTLDGSIQVEGQKITLIKTAEEMQATRAGKFVHDMQFTTGEDNSTLYRGFFEIINDSTL